MIASISTAITALKFIKKNWALIALTIVIVSFGITMTVMSVKIQNRNKRIDKLEVKVDQLRSTNTYLLKHMTVNDKGNSRLTNFSSSAATVSNINNYSLSNDVIESINDIINNYNHNLIYNTLNGGDNK